MVACECPVQGIVINHQDFRRRLLGGEAGSQPTGDWSTIGQN